MLGGRTVPTVPPLNTVPVGSGVFCFFLIFGDGSWRQAEAWIVLLAGAVEVTKERYGNSLSGSNTQPSNWEADT